MRRRSFTLTCLLVGLLLTSGLPAAIPGAQARQVMPDPDSETMGLPLSFPEPTWDEAGGYIKLQLDGATGNVRVAGAPLLPMWGRMLGFPVGTRILEVFLSNTTYTENTITRTVLPAPEPVPMVAGAEESLFEGPAYAQSALYPSGETDYTVTTGMGEQGGIEAHLFVKVFPVRYNPVSGLVRVLRTADLDIRFESPPVRAPPANETYDILVLAPPEFESEMGRYKAHKEEVGFSVKLVNLTAVYAGSIFNVSAGRDNPEKIKLFIKQALENWTIRHVVLTGDVEKFPVRRAYFLDYYDSSNLPTDLYYEDIYKAGTKTFCDWDKDRDNLFAECYPSTNPDAVDLDPDVTVGRLPAGSESELRGMINKTISYAENVTRGNWFQNLTLVGTDTFGPSRGETSGVAEGEYACDVAYAYLPGFNASKFYEKKGTFSISAIRDCLNRGEGYAIFANHGATDGVCYPDSGGGPGLSSSNAAALTNGPRLPLSVLDACSTHAIDSNDCLGENLVLNPRGGSINSIGATRVAYGGWSTWHVQGNSGYLNVHLAEQFGKGTIMPGVMLGRAKQSYMANLGIWNYADMKTMIQYIGLGDPVTFIGGPGIASTADNQTKWADPGATAEFQITVSNSALHPDEVQLSLVGSRWSAGLNTSFLKLASNASSNVTLRMSVDALADAFEWNNLTVKLLCKSTGLPVRLNLSVRTNCIRKVGFSAGGDGSGALPGSEFGLNYTITNDGNVFENATLAVTGGGPSWSLNTTFPAGEVARRSVQQGCLTLPVSARALAGSYRFQVRLTTDSGIVLDAPLNIEVLRTFGFDIRVETGHAFPDANGAAFRMEVENLGNHPDNCTLAPAGIPAGWTVECPPGMDLGAFAQEAVGCTIMPDEHALAGDYAFQICLYSSEGLLETLNLAVTVNRTSKLQLRCPVDAQAAGQGSDAVFEVVIDSSSNFYEPVELSVQRLPDGWGWFLVSEPLGVEPFSSASAFIAISAPDRCPAGLYLVDVVASTAQWRALRSLSVEIRAARAFIACPDTSQAVLHPGDDASFMVNVQNLGNCRDRYLLGAEGSLPVSFSANLVGIDARSSETFEVVVSVPGTARHGLYELALTVSSTADPALRMTFTIRIMVEKISDMAVEIDTASDVQSGSTGAFWVAATNLGTEEETLVLSGRDLPDWGFSCPADAIPPGKTRRLQVTFTIPAGTAGGSYNLSLVASTDAQSFPMDHLVEVAAPVSLAASGGAGPAAPSLLPYAAAAVIVVLPTAVAALVWRNRRKKGPAGAQCARPSDLPAPAAPPPSPPPPPAVIPTCSPVPQPANYDSQLPLPPPPPPEYLQAGYTALANPLPPPPPWFSPPAQ